MTLLPFFFGLIVAFFPVALLLRVTGGRFFVITNAYFAGALAAFWLWALLMGGLYLDARFGLVGLAASAQGPGLVAILTTSIRGFLVGGLAAGLFWSKALRRR